MWSPGFPGTFTYSATDLRLCPVCTDFVHACCLECLPEAEYWKMVDLLLQNTVSHILKTPVMTSSPDAALEGLPVRDKAGQ